MYIKVDIFKVFNRASQTIFVIREVDKFGCGLAEHMINSVKKKKNVHIDRGWKYD